MNILIFVDGDTISTVLSDEEATVYVLRSEDGPLSRGDGADRCTITKPDVYVSPTTVKQALDYYELEVPA